MAKKMFKLGKKHKFKPRHYALVFLGVPITLIFLTKILAVFGLMVLEDMLAMHIGMTAWPLVWKASAVMFFALTFVLLYEFFPRAIKRMKPGTRKILAGVVTAFFGLLTGALLIYGKDFSAWLLLKIAIVLISIGLISRISMYVFNVGGRK